MRRIKRVFEVFNPSTGKVYGNFFGPAALDAIEDALLTLDPDELQHITLDAKEVFNDTAYSRED